MTSTSRCEYLDIGGEGSREEDEVVGMVMVVVVVVVVRW